MTDQDSNTTGHTPTYQERFTDACNTLKFKPCELIQGPDAGYLVWEVQHVRNGLQVTIDGKKVARIDTGEIVKFKVKPGRHIVGIAGDDEGNGLCAMQIGQPVKEAAAEISSGETQKFRISGTQNGTDIRPSSI
jgi:hypothetical protein